MVFAIKLIDRHIGNIVCSFLSIFARKKSIGHAEKILVVQLWGIGETILTLPAIEALRDKFPKARLDILATSRNKDVFFNNKNVDNVFVLELNPFSILSFIIRNAREYDIAIDMEEYLNISAII